MTIVDQLEYIAAEMVIAKINVLINGLRELEERLINQNQNMPIMPIMPIMPDGILSLNDYVKEIHLLRRLDNE